MQILFGIETACAGAGAGFRPGFERVRVDAFAVVEIHSLKDTS